MAQKLFLSRAESVARSNFIFDIQIARKIYSGAQKAVFGQSYARNLPLPRKNTGEFNSLAAFLRNDRRFFRRAVSTVLYRSCDISGVCSE